MSESDKSDDVGISPTKTKSKKKSLCRLLMHKKTKVGCLSNDPSVNSEDDHSKCSSSPFQSPLKKTSSSSNSSSSSNNHSNLDARNTKISLCCAVTESIRSTTSLQTVEEQRDEPSHKHKEISRGSSLDEARKILSSSMPESPSSCKSTPMEQTTANSAQSKLRRRLLSQRLSADNLLALKSNGNNTSKREEEKKIPSMDCLARHSLLAAHVLHLIPASKARQRNFLHGRIAANSMLGSLELDRIIPGRQLQVFIVTWNMNGQAPPDQLNPLVLPECLRHVPDILAIGTQEAWPERWPWEVGIQESLGPSHLLLHSASLGTLHLTIFVRRDLLWFCSVPEEASISVRPGTAFKTKGAVAIGMMIFGTSFLFITSHLTAHQEKSKERVADMKRIAKALDLPKNLPCRSKQKDVTENYDCVFWFGDLNFRLSQPREKLIEWVLQEDFPTALEGDQLNNSRTQESILENLREAEITFAPTYKYDPGTNNFDTSHKQRAPAYTDRILYKTRSSGTSSSHQHLECIMYQSVQNICTSDHKPVWALFKTSVRPGIDTIPLAAGLFNRDVYLEGIKRRAALLDKRQGTSTVCSIQ